MGKKKKKGKEIKYNESPVSHYHRGKIKHQKKTERNLFRFGRLKFEVLL